MTRRDTAPPRRRWRSGASWWVRGCAAAVALTAGGAGCGGGTSTPDAAVNTEPLWWRPTFGTVKNWDIQLNAPFDVSSPRTMYVLDLWELVPLKMTLDYGDGMPAISVDPGQLAGRVTELHARTPAAVVICYVETGLLEMGRPDEPKFRAAVPAAMIGNAVPEGLAGMPVAQFLDTRAASRAVWAPIMFKRFDLARQIGCDGIAPAHNDVGSYESTGFTIDSADTLSWYTEVATQGHKRMLSTGMLGGAGLPTAYEDEVDKFDWVLMERCGEFEGCDVARPFVNADKPVLALEYQMSADTPPSNQTETVCLKQGKQVTEGLLKKDVQLNDEFRMECEPGQPDPALRRE